ncbi:hypothetical protein EDF78_11232 [Rahnella sp. BIGb0236]|uniref:hypothetical protein n=1 Tax=Rahnella sp. BIGb0236 TaxID=2485117 RepID=UPI00105B5EA3|nr:hypothetical protein [Rahnella sp. BIGb0236]TDS88024.1 hypothetical protein EDF78_11232 [Rahnella sp. BIGb0236]VTQ53390.1 Uncharacterised protein [Campylobacter jejuni]
MLYDWFRRFIFTLLALFIVVIVYFYLSLIYTLDGRSYKKSDFFEYYFLTPSILAHAPEISKEYVFYTQADDNYGFTQDKITWKNVNNVLDAKSTLEAYLAEKNITEDVVDHSGSKYSITIVGNDISLELITCIDSC